MLAQSKLWIEYLAVAVEIAAAMVIGLASASAAIRSLFLLLRGGSCYQATMDVRLGLGRWLALGLEFALAADILRTAITPTWQDIGKLAAIAILRTGLNFFLERAMSRREVEVSV